MKTLAYLLVGLGLAGTVAFTYTLFDNRTDPFQLKNIAGNSPDIIRTLKPELRRLLADTKEPWQGSLQE